MTNTEFVQSVGRAVGVELTDDEADYILWEETGFPCFFDGDPVTVLRQQVTAYLQKQMP